MGAELFSLSSEEPGSNICQAREGEQSPVMAVRIAQRVCDGKHESKGIWNAHNGVIRMNSSIKSGKGTSSHGIWKKLDGVNEDRVTEGLPVQPSVHISTVQKGCQGTRQGPKS